MMDAMSTAPDTQPWWARRASAPRFRTPSERAVRNFTIYTLVSAGVLLTSFMVVSAALLWMTLPAWRWATIPLVLALSAACLGTLRASIPQDVRSEPTRGPHWGWLVAMLVLTSVLGALEARTVFQDRPTALAWYAVLVSSMVWSLTVRTRLAVLLTAVSAVAPVVTMALIDPARLPLQVVLMAFGAALGISTGWASGWGLELVRNQARAQHLAADLAVAEERLRFSRDLHDSFGRILSVTALKSEVASELVQRERTDEALRELEALHQLVLEGVAEVRGIVTGYRSVDPSAELVGAQSLLRSAGVDVDVQGAQTLDQQHHWPPASRDAVGWALREGVTNVLRHSAARRVQISLGADAGAFTLTLRNDRPHPPAAVDPQAPTTGGNGLRGLRERMAAAGGALDHQRDEGTFTLTATVPTSSAPDHPTATDQPLPTDQPISRSTHD